MKGYKICARLPYRLDSYLGRLCCCEILQRELGVVIRIESVVVSWLTGEVQFEVTYVDDKETTSQIYTWEDIHLLRILDRPLSLDDIIGRWNRLYLLFDQASTSDFIGDRFFVRAYCEDYNRFRKLMPRILEINGHLDEFSFKYAVVNHTLAARCGDQMALELNDGL
jgi:hypothetical protein